MKRFRIGVDARPLSTSMSGIGRLIHETIKAFPQSENYEFLLFSHRPIHDHHKSLVTLDYVRWKQGNSILSSKGGLYYNLELPFLLKKENLDLFWGAQQVLPPFLPKNLPCILGYMDLVLYLYPETMRRLARIQQRMFQKYSVNRADFIISISEQTRKDMIHRFRYPTHQTSVAYPGIDPQGIESVLSRRVTPRIQNLPDKYILSVSTIEPRKNYGFLLEVFRALRSRGNLPDIQWVIAGKRGWETKKFYKELAQDREIHKDIILLEGLEDSELHHLYKNSSLFWMASHYEGFGIPVLEALYHKKMAILSNIETFREIGGDSLVYLSARGKSDVDDWVKYTESFIRDQKKYEGSIERFSWANSAKGVEEVFRRFL